MVSIHAPARGATLRFPTSKLFDKVSIHAPARGATFNPISLNADALFQSTPPRGGRLALSYYGT